jgi:hypothetical protein
MFRTGIELNKRKEKNYQNLASLDVFKKALEDDEEEQDNQINPKRKGKINYLALMENNKNRTVLG